MKYDQTTLVLGGASSGKSFVAETLIRETNLPRYYIATAQAFDDDMAAKIEDHKTDRGSGWITLEEPLDLAGAIAQVPEGSAILIDCATMWLNNLMMADADIDTATDALLTQINTCPCPLVIVSNEVGLGGVPANPLARSFGRLQGKLNARLAAAAGKVLMVTAGLPQVLK